MVDTTSANHRPPILIAGDAAVPTGFCRVLESVFGRLKDRYEIHHLGTNYHGDPHPYDWKVYPAGVGGGVWGAARLEGLIGAIKPGLIFIINDIWVLAEYMQALIQLKGGAAPVVMYCPIDAGPIDPETVRPLAGVERFVTYTQFARREVEAAVAAVRAEEPAFAFPEIEVIPHGVDTDVFRPIDSDVHAARTEARRELFPDKPELLDAFIVLNANRNQPRKRIDVTIRGFSLFARNKPPSVKLYLHMGVEDQGWDVVRLARRYEIDDRLILSTTRKFLTGFTTRHLNLVHNACEVGVNTATGEGWGLVSFEHAASRAAQIVPRHSACAELWDGAAVMLDPVMGLINERILTEGRLVTPEGVAAALESLYQDPRHLDEMSERAYRNALKPEHRWDAIARQWGTLFDEVLRAGASRARDGATTSSGPGD